MNLPKPSLRFQALQARLNTLKKVRVSNEDTKAKSKKNAKTLFNRDLEEDVFDSDDFFSEE